MEKPLIANPEIVFRKEGEEGILFNPNTGEIKILNETSTFIYGLLDGKHKREEIIGLLAARYEIDDIKRVEEDVDTFLQKVRDEQLAGELN